MVVFLFYECCVVLVVGLWVNPNLFLLLQARGVQWRWDCAPLLPAAAVREMPELLQRTKTTRGRRQGAGGSP